MLVWWAVLLICIGVAIVFTIIGMIVTRKLIQKQLEQNPPINENMIRAMFMQMGRKPSESQIKAVMRSMKQSR